MKNKKLFAFAKFALLAALLVALTLCCVGCGSGSQIALESEFQDGTVLEYTGDKVQFPLGYVANANGKIQSYAVNYEVIDLSNNESYTDEYATFTLKVGQYQLVYSYANDKNVSKTVNFSIQDTTAPTIEFMDIPNGLFLQDITEDTINKLPLYSIEDASTAEGIDLARVLSFKGESDTEYRQWNYRDINNSYEIESFGTYQYTLTATDAYGNQTVATATWKVKDRDWKPSEMPADGILADYSSEGYCNLIEGGDTNQYYTIGNDYSDEWLAEFEGASGVLKATLGFNNAAGYGNNTIRLRLARSFTQKDLEGKYLAVRMYVEGEHVKSGFLFSGNNVEFREEDSTRRAFTTGVDGLVKGQWMTYYIAADTVEHIGMYPNATYNPNTTFYEGGDPATCIQLCFSREGGYYDDMVLYIDSISIAEVLPDTELTVADGKASWTAVPGAVGYRVDLNGTESIITDTSIKLTGDKGYIRVTPMGDGVLTLDAQTVTGVYGLDAGDKIAAFDDELYAELFSTTLQFSTDAEHSGYKATSLTGSLTGDGLQMDIGAGSWGVVSGVRFQFPKAVSRGDNTTLMLTMNVSDSKFGQIRLYDYTGTYLGVIKLDESNTGKMHTFEVDISSYDKELTGVQFIFGPNSTFTTVPTGVSIVFNSIYLKNTYTPVTIDGQSMMCAGTRVLTPHFTTGDLVQFSDFYIFGVPADNTPLGFSGTVLLDGKKQEKVTVVGYPDVATICFNTVHNGKILTIMKGSYIYYNGIAVEVEETFNAKWNGSEWVTIGSIPAAPADEYVTLADGSKKLIAEKITLTTGYTLSSLVQFTNVYDFGVSAENTPLNFEGTVMLDGEILHNPSIVGYPNLMTITLTADHSGKLLTILEGSVIWYGDKAVVVKETFNMKWNGKSWSSVSQVPEIPSTQYITLSDGTQRELMANVELKTHYTQGDLVQFGNVFDFGCDADNTPLGFEGTVLLNGVEVNAPQFVGYPNNTVICLSSINHKDKVLTIMAGSILYNDTVAVKVKTTFNAKWDGSAWTAVDEIPEAPKTQYITLADGTQRELVDTVELNTGYTADSLVQFMNFYDFGCSADNTPLGFEGTVMLDGKRIANPQFIGYPNNTIICLNNINHKDKVLTVMEGAILYNDTVAVKVKSTFNAKWDGIIWTAVDEIPEPPTTQYITLADGSERELVDTVELKVHWQDNSYVQFGNFYDFGCGADNTPIGFEGTVLLDGETVANPQFVGYPDTATICLNSINHKDKVLTIMEGAILYNDTVAVKVKARFNATWDGSEWTAVADIPVYATLTADKTGSNYVQFKDFYNFGIPNNGTELTFDGKVMLDGEEVENPTFVGYKNNANLRLKNVDHKGKVLTIMAGSKISYNGTTVTVKTTFNATWDGKEWTDVANIPGADLTATLTAGYTASTLVQFPGFYDFGVPVDNTALTFEGTVMLDGKIVEDPQFVGYANASTICLTNIDTSKLLTIMAGSKLSYGTTTVTIENTFNATWNGKTDGSIWTDVAEVPDIPDPALTLAYRWGNANTLQVNTDLPTTVAINNFLATDNGCNLIQGGDQQFGWAGMIDADGTIVITFNFNSEFAENGTYTLAAGSVFGFADGSKYTLDKNYVFTFNGSEWSMTATEPETPDTPAEENKLSFAYRWGNATVLQINTDLPATTPLKDFLATDNGCDIDQTLNQYQNFGYVSMANADDTIVLTFNFGSAFEAGQTYVLPAGAIFGFTDGNTYKLDKNYVFNYDGTTWTMVAAENAITLTYRDGNAGLIQYNTELTDSVPLVDFTSDANGCALIQSGDQTVGWVGMDNADGTIVLSFHFNSEFAENGTYTLSAGSLFGFTDESTYLLMQNLSLKWDGSKWVTA